ncbi:MAG: alpha/beta fold hydrolase [Nevskiales bacterium]
MRPAEEYCALTQNWTYADDRGPRLLGRYCEHPGKPLLHFIHGTGFCGGAYWTFLRLLQDEAALILHDVQGHGASEVGDKYLGPHATAERALHALAAHPLNTPGRDIVGVGHSYGGYVHALMAAREPQRFKALVLLDPIFLPPLLLFGMCFITSRFNPLVKRSLKRRAEWPSRAAAWQGLHQRGIFKGWPDEALECYVAHALREHADGRMELRCPPWLESALFARPPWNTWRAIRQLQCPVLILHGAQSYPFMAPSIQRAVCANPHIRAENVPGGHCFMHEHPEAVADRIKRFLAEVA